MQQQENEEGDIDNDEMKDSSHNFDESEFSNRNGYKGFNVYEDNFTSNPTSNSSARY